MNPLKPRLAEGTVGELLVVLRLLEYDVQASFTLKDTGNDLIAIKGHSKKTIQVKTSIKNNWGFPLPHKMYDILALVSLVGEGSCIFLDKSKIYLLSTEEVGVKTYFSENMINDFLLNENRVNKLFA